MNTYKNAGAGAPGQRKWVTATGPRPASVLGRESAVPRRGTLTRKGESRMVLFRQELGGVLREARRRQGKTLRQVSADARVSLGYLSEIERGQKEASSELLASVTEALGYPMSVILREVADRVALEEGIVIPDTVPAELERGVQGAEYALAR
ncbi:XRE family transcriptional regulator, stress-response regulator [Dermabacter hominis]